MKENDSGRLFGKYNDILKLAMGFFLTTIVGGYLSHSWQTRAAEIQRDAEQKKYEIQTATGVFEQISRLMDKRLYRMRQVSMGLGNEVGHESMTGRWEAYRETLYEWNENLNRNLALTQMYFGQKARDTLEQDIQSRFITFGRLLESSRDSGRAGNTYEERLAVADDLNNYIYNFDLLLIENIQNGTVGSFRK